MPFCLMGDASRVFSRLRPAHSREICAYEDQDGVTVGLQERLNVNMDVLNLIRDGIVVLVQIALFVTIRLTLGSRMQSVISQ